MSIEKYGFEREITCDVCGDGFGETYSADDFDVMIKDAKEAGWKFRKEEGVWSHYCPACQ